MQGIKPVDDNVFLFFLELIELNFWNFSIGLFSRVKRCVLAGWCKSTLFLFVMEGSGWPLVAWLIIAGLIMWWRSKVLNLLDGRLLLVDLFLEIVQFLLEEVVLQFEHFWTAFTWFVGWFWLNKVLIDVQVLCLVVLTIWHCVIVLLNYIVAIGPVTLKCYLLSDLVHLITA